MHTSSKTSKDELRDLSHLTEEEQVEYLIKMTEEEAKIDFRAGVEFKSPGKMNSSVCKKLHFSSLSCAGP